MHFFKHLHTINSHRHLVMKLCFKVGLYKQGLLHDLSKYSPIELMNGAKYYQGTYSPHFNERKNKGYSEAWMHHKGRNKHHAEYWQDANIATKEYEAIRMPFNYLLESICDRIAASMIYNKGNYNKNMPLEYLKKEGKHIIIHQSTYDKIEELLTYYRDHDDKDAFRYFKSLLKKYKRSNQYDTSRTI